MGYSAELIQGDPIIIERPDLVLEQLIETQKGENSYNGQGGHISWCHPVETYLANAKTVYTDLEEAAAHALKQLLEDYGFSDIAISNWSMTGHPFGSLTIGSWGGDKIGSSWDTVWNGLARGYNAEHPTVWIMQGEDLVYWGQMISKDNAQELQIQVSYEVKV